MRRFLPARLKARLRRLIGRAAAESVTFPQLAYLPYRPGEDYALPLVPPRDPSAPLPVPPEQLWVGAGLYHDGERLAARMLDLVRESGLEFAPGDRILDLGCGAGRIIRHLAPLAATCEIWGADIKAEPIFWLQANLSPPFNFVTTTKVPHLPFADGSFRFVYATSVFTHIDDLADAWLLELRRILAPDGRLYLTIHDRHTMERFDAETRDIGVIRDIRSHRLYREGRDGFGMMTLDRDHRAMVFYDLPSFLAKVRPMFEMLSVTEEAFNVQTALVLKPSRRSS